MHQPGLLADLLPQHGAIAAAQHRGEQIEDRCVRMRESGNRPSEGAAGELDILEAVLSPRSELERLGRNQHGGEARARRAAEVLLDRGAGRGEIDIAHNDDDQIVRHVTRSVVADEIFPGDGGKHLAVANHGLTIRMLAESRRKKRVPQSVIRVILRHRDLAENNVFLLRRFVGRERGVQYRVGEQVDSDRRVLTGQIDVVNRAVKGRIGIDVAAVRLHRRGNFAAGPARSALEQHVFKIMRQPRAQVGVLVNAPRFHPDLHRSQGSGAIRFEDQRQTIGEDGALNGLAPKSIEQVKISGGGGQQCGHEGGLAGGRESFAQAGRKKARPHRGLPSKVRFPEGGRAWWVEKVSRTPSQNRRFRKNLRAGRSRFLKTRCIRSD